MNHLSDKERRELEEFANELRATVIEALVEAGSGHSAGPLGMADIFAYLYLRGLRHDPKRPDSPERDRLVLSNGHICPVLYAAMAHAGYLGPRGVEEFKKNLRKFGSPFQGHPHREFLPALETSSGPLGSGLSQAVGMALADRMDAISGRRIFCLMSDGEQDCGNTWEAAMLAGKEKLADLIGVIDRNDIQIDGFTRDVMPLAPLVDKWRTFGWNVLEIDGHDFEEIAEAFEKAKTVSDKPSVIIAKTVPGKGVPFMEGRYEWHGKPPTREEGERALKALHTLGVFNTSI